jgi:cystathionine beta-lyase/cystathionine gamma-synthase
MSSPDFSCNDDNILAHLGDEYSAHNDAVVPPVYLNSLFVVPKEELGAFKPRKFSYSRGGNPTVDIFEQKVAALERAEEAAAFSSGMAAITSSIFANIKAGEHIVAVETVYGGMRHFVQEYLSRFNVEVSYVQGDRIEQFEESIKPNTKIIYLESPSSLVFMLQDLRAVAELAKKKGIITIIDNSWATPLLQKPITMGIDISLHSASKYLGGHSDIVAGVAAGSAGMIGKIRNVRSIYGGTLQPMEAWLAIRGLRTLKLRVRAEGQTAMFIAKKLESHPRVRKVNYPGLESFPQRSLALSQMSGFSSPLSFELDCSESEGVEFVRRNKWFAFGPSWGGFESLIHWFGGEQRLVRIHTGLEDRKTLWKDLKDSLDAIKV